MRKNLLLILFAAFYCFSAVGQSNCPTCQQGRHVFDSSNSALWASRAMMAPSRVGNGNSSLGQSYVIQNVCGLNYVTGSVITETRSQPYSFNTNGTGFPTTIAISGIPNCFIVQQAYLYWEASYTEATPPAVTANVTNPLLVSNNYTSVIAGTGLPKCWAETGTACWRADVTAAISGNGNYKVNLTGFNNAAYEVDGCTLVIVYTSPATYSGSISLWDGDISTGYVALKFIGTYTGFTVCAASPTASTFAAFGDMQSNTNAGINKESYNGSPSTTFNNIMWNLDQIGTSVTTGQTSVTFDTYTNNSSDCYDWILAGLYWQNTTCQVCSGSSLTLTFNNTNPTCGNNNGTATVTATGGSSPYTYLWQPGGQTNASATGLSVGVYTVQVISGCDTSIATDTLKGVSLLLSKNFGNVKCNGGTTGFGAVHVIGGVPPYTYLWNPTASTNDSIFNLSAGSYTVTVTDVNGCNTNDTITITQPPLLSVSATTTGESCNGGSTGTATATGAGGTPPYGYVWNNGQTTDTATGLSAGTFTVTVVDANGCTATNTATVTQPAVLAVTLSGPQTICAGDSGTLTATVSGGTSPYAYSWSGGSTSTSSTAIITPNVSTAYTVTVTDANGCITTKSIVVSLGPPLTVSIKDAHSICSGGTLTICAVTNGGTGGNVYTWQPGNLSGPCITISPSASTTYTLSVTDNCGTPAMATAYIPVNPSPNVKFSADVMQGCAPLCIQFRDKTTMAQGQIAAWSWRFGSGDTSNHRNPIYCYPDSGHFGVTLTAVSDSGCSATLSILNMIDVYSHPNAQFSTSPQPTDIMHANIQFTDKTTDAYGLSYWYWNFGDGNDSTSNLENPTHTYQDTGTYCAKLVAMNNHGCTDTIMNCLVIDPVFTLYIPDAFTPNGNNRNEVFMAKGDYVKTFQMYIFDRWGTQLFYSNDIYKGWDGTVKSNGQVAQEDTYIYKINVTDSKNKQHSYIGNVSIIK